MDILHSRDCLAYIIKNHRFACLTSGSEHLFKDVSYVTWHKKNEHGNCLDVRDDIAYYFYMISYKPLAPGALILGITIIVDNILMHLCYRCYKRMREGKDQESIQSGTTPDPGHHLGKWQNTIKYHIQGSQEVILFQAGDHKATMNRQENMTNTKHK